MKEKYEGIEYEIERAIVFLDNENNMAYSWKVYCYNDYTCQNEEYKDGDYWHETEKQARDAAIEYITSKMQLGER